MTLYSTDLVRGDVSWLERQSAHVLARATLGSVVVHVDGPDLPAAVSDINRALAIVVTRVASEARLLVLVGGATAYSVLRRAGPGR